MAYREEGTVRKRGLNWFNGFGKNRILILTLLFFFIATPFLSSCGGGGGDGSSSSQGDGPSEPTEPTVTQETTDSNGEATFSVNGGQTTFKVVSADNPSSTDISSAIISVYSENNQVLVFTEATGYFSSFQIFQSSSLSSLQDIQLTPSDSNDYDVEKSSLSPSDDIPFGEKITTLSTSELNSYIASNYSSSKAFVFFIDSDVTSLDTASIDLYQSQFDNVLYLHAYNSSTSFLDILGPRKAYAIIGLSFLVIVTILDVAGAFLGAYILLDIAKEAIPDEPPSLALSSPGATVSDITNEWFSWTSSDNEYDISNAALYAQRFIISKSSDPFSYYYDEDVTLYKKDNVSSLLGPTSYRIQHDFGGLENGEVYYWGVCVVDGVNPGVEQISSFTYVGSIINNPPYEPSNPSPAYGATDQSIDVDLSWSGGDSDGDSVIYYIYLSTTLDAYGHPYLHGQTTDTTTYDPGTLSYDAHYYWQIFVLDGNNGEALGPVWGFYTKENHSPIATITSPSDGTYTEGDTITFSGSGYDAEEGTLDVSSLVWTSSIDGEIGTGISFTRDDLSVGTHTITLTVTDSEGATGSDSVSITVNSPENTSPTATITSPSGTYTEGDTITFSGTGEDVEDGDLTGSSLVWTSSIDGQIGTGTSFTKNDLSVGTHTITLTVTDSEGATGSDSVSITVNSPENTSPTATITSPSGTYTEGDTITFSGTGEDVEDGDLTGSSLVWTSSIDGQIGTGTSFTKNDLSVGTHTITLTATDSEGATGSDSVSITITLVAGDYITIISVVPASAVEGQRTTFTVEVSYGLESDSTAEVCLGFNRYVHDEFIISECKMVDQGEGTLTLMGIESPVYWPAYCEGCTFKALVAITNTSYSDTFVISVEPM